METSIVTEIGSLVVWQWEGVGRTEGGFTEGHKEKNVGGYAFVLHLGCGRRYTHVKTSNCTL